MRRHLSRIFQVLVEGFATSGPYYGMPYFIRVNPYFRIREDRR